MQREAAAKAAELRKKKERDRRRKMLHEACFDGDIVTAREMLELEPSLLEECDGSGYTPLSNAANGGSLEVVQLLTEKL